MIEFGRHSRLIIAMPNWWSACLACLLLCTRLLAEVHGQEQAFTPDQIKFFEAKIRPVLVEHCYECHAADAKILQGGLRVDHRAGLLKGGDSGPAMVPKEPTRGSLLKALRYEDVEMPPNGKLAASVIADFEAWLAMGAPDPRRADDLPTSRQIDIDEGRKFWAFQPVCNPPQPAVKAEAWPLDPIDYFILAKQEAMGIQPVVDADRYTWLRRVTLDLTGLPPTPEDIESFVHDNSPRACEAVVDRLLSSRAYGERWARHWLDLTGYADMMGTSNNVFAEHAWRYRDYLIHSLHEDKPFDRFVREQIAGDLLPFSSPEERAENLTATGFLMVGDVEIVEPDKAKMEADHIDTQVSKIGMAFLGMTLGCVRCHDHKFDPIGLQDYYGIAGMLRSSPSTHKIPFGVWSKLNEIELPESPEQLAARQLQEADHAEKLVELRTEQAKLNHEKKALASQILQLEKDAANNQVAGTMRLPSSQSPKAKANVQVDVQTDVDGDAKIDAEARVIVDSATIVPVTLESLTKRRDELAEQLKKLAAAIQHAEFFRSKVPKAFAMRDGEQPADMPIYIRGNPYAPGITVPRGVVRVASWKPFPGIPPGQSGRLQLADWLADQRNPLTARVAVNRIWQKLLGEGLVRSVDYFGIRGDLPSHPDLLDHLAYRFMNNGWSQKQLIRAIVLSRTYRLSSSNDVEPMRVDPDNRLVWRMNRQRLEAESLRDGLLAISGELQPANGGPGLVLEEVENCGALAQEGVNPPNYTHRQSRASQEYQRTIYLPVMRNSFNSEDRLRVFFDFVNPAQIVGQRNQTVVPTQLLFVMNNELFRQRSKALAELLISASSSQEERLNQLWLRVFNRPITSREREDAVAFLTHMEATLESREASARESLSWQELSHSLLASNEFLFRI